MNRNDPSERIWNALKQLARDEQGSVTQIEAVKRVKAIVRREGALELPGATIDYYAREYLGMVSANKKSG